jgi:hypothetical protein
MELEALKGETRIILSGDQAFGRSAFGRLKLDDSALQRDGHCMGAIAGPELRQNVGDAALDGCLRDN